MKMFKSRFDMSFIQICLVPWFRVDWIGRQKLTRGPLTRGPLTRGQRCSTRKTRRDLQQTVKAGEYPSLPSHSRVAAFCWQHMWRVWENVSFWLRGRGNTGQIFSLCNMLLNSANWWIVHHSLQNDLPNYCIGQSDLGQVCFKSEFLSW